MHTANLSLLFAKLSRRAPRFTRYDGKGLLVTEWLLHDVKRYDFDCYLLDHYWQILPTLEDGSNFGIWANPHTYCILHYDHGKTRIAQYNNLDLFNAELATIKTSGMNLGAQSTSLSLTKRQFL